MTSRYIVFFCVFLFLYPVGGGFFLCFLPALCRSRLSSLGYASNISLAGLGFPYYPWCGISNCVFPTPRWRYFFCPRCCNVSLLAISVVFCVPSSVCCALSDMCLFPPLSILFCGNICFLPDAFLY